MQAGTSSFRDEAEDVEEQPLVRNRTRRRSPGSTESVKDADTDADISSQSSTGHQDRSDQQHNGTSFPSDEV